MSVGGSVQIGRRDQRYRQLEFLNGFSKLKGLRSCMTGQADYSNGVGLMRRDGRAHYRNVKTCASVHACPVCAPKIRNGRADEVSAAAKLHLERGGGLLFVTYTLPHDQGDRLDPLIAAVAGAYRQVVSGRAAKDRTASYGLCGTIRALEVTYGVNGWHPHLHVLVFTEAPVSARGRRLLRADLGRSWGDAITGYGYRRPSARHGVDVRPVWGAEGIGQYATKIDGERVVGLEMARPDLKRPAGGKRTPWSILADLVDRGDVADLALWWEYETATRGRRALWWSHGLKARFGVGVATDEELANPHIGGELVAMISPQLWPAVCSTRGLRLRLIRLAEANEDEAINEALAKTEIECFGDVVSLANVDRDGPGARKRRAIERRLAGLRVLRRLAGLDELQPLQR